MDKFDKEKIRDHKDYKQAKWMLKSIPDSASMYIEAIAQATGYTEEEVEEVIREDL